MEAKSTTKPGQDLAEIKKAADVKTDDAACGEAKRKADKTLDAAACEAKKAEAFDHGKEDAGKKSQ